jgi:protein-L-isoaspartate(D-aspartate) O-methyltransferase
MSDWLLDQKGLAIVRRAYARQMLGVAGVRNDRLERVFATIRREDFLGTEPWLIVRYPPGPALPVNDPVYIYQDVVLALAPERGVNNGSPSLHAKMLNDLAVEPGQHIAHIGAGAGYYTAMLAELTGASGRVTAIEFDVTLAERAHLAAWRQVKVISGDGGSALSESVDRIYVNFAVTAPAASWLEHLKPGGKLLFALGVPHPDVRAKFPRHAARGAAFLIDRTANGFPARWLCPAYYVCAEGSLAGGDADAELALYHAFERGGFEFVRSLRWNESIDPMRCWYSTPRWSLGFDALEGE